MTLKEAIGRARPLATMVPRLPVSEMPALIARFSERWEAQPEAPPTEMIDALASRLHHAAETRNLHSPDTARLAAAALGIVDHRPAAGR